MNKSGSYKIAECCGDDCYAIDNEEEVCWGEVSVIGSESFTDDDYYWVHACEGHVEKYHAGDYIEEK